MPSNVEVAGEAALLPSRTRASSVFKILPSTESVTDKSKCKLTTTLVEGGTLPEDVVVYAANLQHLARIA